MADRSSTSSSDGLAIGSSEENPDWRAGAPAASRAPAHPRRRPSAVFFAIGLAVLIHVGAARLRPEPVARPELRDKARSLTRQRTPMVVISGDSCVKCGIIPALLAEKLGLPSESIINMAESACDTSAVVAAYTEYAHRFASDPTLIVNLSFFSANDGAGDILGDELLWSLSFRDRLRLAGLARTVRSMFLPEKAVWQDLTRFWPRAVGRYAESGFESAPAHLSVNTWTPDHRRDRADALRQWWYNDLRTDGLRWKKLRADLETLAGYARLHVLLMPPHPSFITHIQDTAAGEAEQRFRAGIQDLCDQLGIVCLSYDAECLRPTDPDCLFHDLVHLNRAGAEVFTTVLARDLAGLKTAHGRAQPLARGN